MNTIRRLKNIKGRKYCTQPYKQKFGVLDTYMLLVMGCGVGGACYGFYSTIMDIHKPYKVENEIPEIVGETIMYGVAGLVFGVISPVVVPIAIPAYVCLQIKSHME